MRLIDADAEYNRIMDIAMTALAKGDRAKHEVFRLLADLLKCAETVEAMPPFPQWVDDIPKWIPCSERLPDKGIEVLISTDNEYCTVGSLEKRNGVDNEWYYYDCYRQFDSVVAWMPLPEPYYEGGEEND